jgi:fumarate hydratase class I
VPGHRHRDHHGQEGPARLTDGDDEAALAEGARDAYLRATCATRRSRRCRCSRRRTRGNNMPAQIEIYAEGEDAYKFLFMAKGGGSANKSFLFQATPRC